MAEHFLSLVEHLVFSIFMPILTKANYCSDGNKQTNKKKTTSKYHCWTICFFDIHANFDQSQLLLRWKQTNKQKKNNFQRTLLNDLFFSVFHPNFGIPKKASTFYFFFDFRHKAVWWTLLLLFASPFYCNQRFCIQRLLLLKGFSVIKKREVYLCWQDFFYLVLGTRGLDKQIKNIFFRWSKRYLESEKKRAKNTSSASHHVAQLFHIIVI